MRQKDARQFVEEYVAQGWRELPRRDKDSHRRLLWPPSGDVIAVPGSPSDHRSLLNTRARMRRVMRGAYTRGRKGA